MIPIFYSDEFLDHETGRGHPECPDRLTAIKAHLESMPWADQLDWRSPTPIDSQDDHTPDNQRAKNRVVASQRTGDGNTGDQALGQPNLDTIVSLSDRLQAAILAVHPPEHLALIRSLSERGGGAIDPDTIVSPQSYRVATLAVSAWLDGVDEVLATHRPAFALVRPPGHHATTDQSMGFCLLSNAAIAAIYALEQPDIKSVAILDWDVHHGNGTQAIVEHIPAIRYCSLHEYPHYPGTGARTERGEFDNVLNIPMPAGSTGDDYDAAFENEVIPFLTRDRPDLLIVSAGYDATHADFLSRISLQPEDFGRFTRHCLDITPTILFGLEGGYDFKTLAQSVSQTLYACID